MLVYVAVLVGKQPYPTREDLAVAAAAVCPQVNPFPSLKLPGPFSQNEDGAGGGKECPYMLRRG